jgi:WD40 repeat protein
MNLSTLKGHTAAVNDVVVSDRAQIFATASEDGTVRIWDQRTDKSVKCYREFFSSPPQLVRFSLEKDNSLFVADENFVYELDLAAEGVLIRAPLRSIDRGSAGGMDISALAVGLGGRLAVGGDDGAVCVFDTNDTTGTGPVAKLEGSHTNLVGSIAVGSNHTAYTGGFDSLLVSWDTQSGHELKSFNFGGCYAGNTNPPFIHSLSLVSLEQEHDAYLLCALGNGRICLMNSGDLTPVASVEASGGMVSSMFSKGNRVCSAGTRLIKIWDIRETEPLAPEPAVKLSASAQRRLRRKAGQEKPKPPVEYCFSPVGGEIEHSSKINAVSGYFSVDSTKVYVADTTSSISVYNFIG